MVIYLEVPDKIVVERFSGRRTDPITGDVYNVKTNPAPAEIKEKFGCPVLTDVHEKEQCAIVAEHAR